ncbi:SdiA-regulated domain-containing protein [Chitinophagaceae bacterium MMS25-I14]
MRKCFILSLILLAASCVSGAGKKKTFPNGYSWADAREVKLEEQLDEISGMAYVPALHSIITHNDEKGKIYIVDTAAFRIKEEIRFAEKGDYEDIVCTDSNWYVLRSDGHLWQMKYTGAGVTDVNEYVYPGKEAEFEAMYWDKKNNTIELVVKNAHKDHKEETTHGYAFDIAKREFSVIPSLVIHWADIAAMANADIKTFRPSAAAVHPLTGELYILASIEKLLVVLNPAGKVSGVYHLDPKLCWQAEGLTFDTEGNMYISNEAADIHPNIIKFPYHPKN